MRTALFFIACLLSTDQSLAQNYSHSYEHFFGKEDRIGLYSEAARAKFSLSTLHEIQKNTLLIECGSSGKPATAFIAKTQNGPRIISAAHNLMMAKHKGSDCKLGKTSLPQGRTSKYFKDDSTLDDAAHDIAKWPNVTNHQGFEICESINTSSNFILAQSLDGSGRLGLSPQCRVSSIDGNLITTTCRGHYKASGAPLLAISHTTVCVAGVFNAHSGKRMGYESYAARLSP